MSDPAPDTRRLEAIRSDGERLESELAGERHLWLAGRSAALDLAPVYARHPLPDVPAGAPVPLVRWAAEHRLARAVAEQTRALSLLDGPRRLAGAVANEADRDRRGRLAGERDEALDEAEPHLLDLVRGWRRAGAAADPALDALAGECRELLDETERLHASAVDALVRARAGVGLAQAAEHDLARTLRDADRDPLFRAEHALPALASTLAGLGLDLRDQANVRLELEDAPERRSAAFCAPLDVPERVVLSARPSTGSPAWRALFAAAGEALCLGGSSPELPFELRRAGDPAVSAGFGLLLRQLVDEPEWLVRRLDFPRPRDAAEEAAAAELLLVRRDAALLLFELELHAAAEPLDPRALRARYAELSSDALQARVGEPGYLAAVADTSRSLRPGHVPFRTAGTLRARALEAQLREFLREELGRAWFARRVAGSLLRELWALGGSLDADALMRELGGSDVSLASVAERLRESLRSR